MPPGRAPLANRDARFCAYAVAPRPPGAEGIHGVPAAKRHGAQQRERGIYIA